MNLFIEKAEKLTPKLKTTKKDIHTQTILDVGETKVFDFGTHFTGYLTVDFSCIGQHDAPCMLKVRFAEHIKELSMNFDEYQGWVSKSWLQQEVIHIDTLPCKFNFSRRYAFRYVAIEVVALSNNFKLQIDNLMVKAVSSVNCKVDVVGKDELEKSIDKVALKTLSECMQSVFEDGPKRDRRLWLGDLRIQALTNYYTYKNNDLVKRCLYLFAGTINKDGKLPQSVFLLPTISGDLSYMVDYSLLFVCVLQEYLEYTNDINTVKELLPTAEKQIEVAKTLFTNDIMNDSDRLGWCFLDWSLELNKQCGANAVFICAENALLKIYKKLKIDYKDLKKDIKIKKEKVAERFFDKDFNLFVSGNKQISYATNCWCVLAEIFDKDKNVSILNSLENNKNAIKPITPYMYHYYLQALCEVGEFKKAGKVLKDYWGAMVKDGADTFYELFNPANPNESPYGGVAIHSYCHAWSCSPAYFLRRYGDKL